MHINIILDNYIHMYIFKVIVCLCALGNTISSAFCENQTTRVPLTGKCSEMVFFFRQALTLHTPPIQLRSRSGISLYESKLIDFFD